MWIRSQDKETLIKCENIYCAGKFVCCGEGVILGKYSTKEKELIVLNMIERHLRGVPTTHTHCSYDREVKRYHRVFEMPQEEEI